MKSVHLGFRHTAAFLGLALVALGGLWTAKLIWFKPFNVDHLYERVFLRAAIDDPQMLTQIGMLESTPFRWYNARLTDYSMERAERNVRRFRRELDILASYREERLTESQRLSRDILTWFAEQNFANDEFMYHNYPVNQLFGVQNNLPEFMTDIHRIEDLRGARHYVRRLEQFDRQFNQVVEGMDYRLRHGIAPPRFVVDHVLREMRDFIAPPVGEHMLYTHLTARLEALEDIDDRARDRLLSEAWTAMEESVYPGYEALIEWFENFQPYATTDDGVWKLPDGERYYRHLLRGYTTTEMDADTIHRIGREQVARILAEMDIILNDKGWTGGSVAERLQALSQDPRFLYPDSDEGRQQILEGYQAIIDEIDADMHRYFGRLPKAGVEVRRIPEFREATAPGAYYRQPPMDGSRPGVFYANLRDVSENPSFGMRTLAYHEAVPGHHFQIAIQQELEGLPTFRGFPLFTAYIEGWALYAEQLAAELGFQDDPYDRLGYLQAQLFRAVRLVVDTGIHHQRWTRDEAIEYMSDNTGMPRADVVTEIERYIVLPGQATAYMVGKLRIVELREQARERLGERFDLMRFHDVVLGSGAVPLSILERLVDEWVEEVLESPQG
jgi:uncharacterized protein (DUF885 family)